MTRNVSFWRMFSRNLALEPAVAGERDDAPHQGSRQLPSLAWWTQREGRQSPRYYEALRPSYPPHCNLRPRARANLLPASALA